MSYLGNRMVRPLILLLLSGLLLSSLAAQQKIRVAVFPLHPLNYIDSEGTAQGLFPDLVRALVHEDEWLIEFVPTTWSMGLQLLQDEDIDLMTTVAFTKERSLVMDYSQESVTDIWGQIFTTSEARIGNMKDLHHQTVGIMRQDINGMNFINTSSALGVVSEILEYSTHDEIFAAIQRGDIFAGVAPQHFGLRHAEEYDLVATSIMFSPFSVYFACKKGKNPDLLKHIDTHLRRWKADPQSVYHDRLQYWMHGAGIQKRIIPRWILWLVALGSILSVSLIFLNQYLNYQIRQRTHEIELKEKQYRDLVEGANSVILRLDVSGRLVYINNYGIDLFGYSSEELVGTLVTDNLLPVVHFPGKDLTSSMELIVADNRMYKLMENQIYCKDGHKVHMQWSNKTIYDEQGEPSELLSIGTDITDKKRSELELVKSTILINAMLDGIPDALLAIDTSDRIVSVNRAFTTILGWTEDQIMGDHPSHLFANPKKYPYESSDREAFLKSNFTTPQIFHYQRKNREVFPGETITVPMYATDNSLLGYISIIRDVTERQSLEEQVRRSQKLEALGIMVGGIAHDFNNILQSIMLSSETALSLSQDQPQLKTSILDILKDSDRAKRLIQQVLTFGRNTEVELKPVFIQNILHDALKFERSHFPRTIRIEQDIDENCPAVLCDEIQMHQVVINICNNAMQAIGSEKGELKVQLARLESRPPPIAGASETEKPREYLELHITDTGVGMDEDTRTKVFDPFFSTKVVGEGTGLGLSVVHNIVKNIDGLINVESELGVGTTLSIWLPTTEKLPADKPKEGKKEIEIFTLPILFVDDESSIRTVLSKMLQKRGFTVDIAEDGALGLEKYSENPDLYGLIVTDLNMPNMTGVELAQAIRDTGSEVPIILSSGDLSAEERTDYKSKGISGFIQKPWSIDELVTQLSAYENQT